MTGPISTRGHGAFPAFTAKRQDPAAADPAVTLYQQWLATDAEVHRLAKISSEAEDRLPVWALDYPAIPPDHPAFANLPRPDTSEPIRMPREALEKWLSAIEEGMATLGGWTENDPRRDKMRRKNAERLAVYDSLQAEIDAASRDAGYTAAYAALEAAGARQSEIERALAETVATTIAGIAAKLAVALKYGISTLGDPTPDERIIMSSLADAERLAGKGTTP